MRKLSHISEGEERESKGKARGKHGESKGKQRILRESMVFAILETLYSSVLRGKAIRPSNLFIILKEKNGCVPALFVLHAAAALYPYWALQNISSI